MSRYTGPIRKKSRRLNYSISDSAKDLKNKPYPPGIHGKKRRRLSEYAIQLQEKQRLKFSYGITEKQLKKYFLNAKKIKGNLGAIFLSLLEKRLDNIVYRSGFATTRRQARQFVNHGHIVINGGKVDIPSYSVKVGDKIQVNEKSKDLVFIKENLESIGAVSVPYIEINNDDLSSTLIKNPDRETYMQDIQENLVVEYYTK